MKRISLALVAALFFIAAGTAFGQSTPYIARTAHNFSSQTWSGNQICKPCHTPHNAQPGDVSHAIWSHDLSTATYTTADATGVAIDDALDPYSRLCMSCHDGTVGIDAYSGHASTAGTINAKYNIGTDLSNDHPVGNEAAYPGTPGHNASGSFRAPTAGNRGGNAYYYVAPVDATKGGNLNLRLNEDGIDWIVSCGTCHNPHGAGTGGAPFPSLLRQTNEGSNLCFTCHIK